MKTIENLHDLGIDSSSRILTVMPHPDDEAFLCSVLLYRIARKNIPQRAITLTKGGKSTKRFTISDNDDLVKIRTKELENAYTTIGVDDFTIYDIPDGEIKKRKKEVVAILKKEYAQFRPTHIVTFEPDGVYGHPDHIFLTKFVQDTKPKNAHIIYCTVAKDFKTSAGARALSEKKDINPLKPTHCLPLSWQDFIIKFKTLYCHKTQFPLTPSYLWKSYQRGLFGAEYFAIA